MIRFLKRGDLVVVSDLRIALPVGGSGHRKVHPHLAALSLEIGAKIILDILRDILRDADHMLRCPAELSGLLHELRCRGLAHRALLGRLLALKDITTDRTNPCFHKLISFSAVLSA